MKTGFIGLGNMGSRMAARLLGAGYTVLAYNRTSSKLKPLVELGAQAVDSVARVSREAEVLFTCLSMPAVTEEVYLKQGGILENGRKGLICVDLATVGIETSRGICAEAEKKGIHYLDAPVSGGPEGAGSGTLTVMVGGDRDAFAAVEPLLKVIGENVQRLGGSGFGSAAKLLNQYLVAVHNVAAAEVMIGAEEIGLDRLKLYDLLKASYGRSRMLERLVEQFLIPGNFEPGGATKYLLKDLKLSNSLLSARGVEPSSGKQAGEVYERAYRAGWGEKDMASVYLYLRSRLGASAVHDEEA